MRSILSKPVRPLLVLVALGCAATPDVGAAAATIQEDGFEPIRFGDDDASTYDVPFFPGVSYDGAIPTPDSFLGQPLGSRLARHDEVLAAFRAWSEASPRIDVQSYGRTYEGRELVYAVITSESNMAALDSIKAGIGKLADPRGLSDAEAERIVSSSPAIAWLGYSIHGDEVSGVDAALSVAHHLIASTDASVSELLDELVIVMDPCMNPDGRQRILTMLEQSAGYRGNRDHSSMHRGRWPAGRGNHYLFDMNRDWMTGVCPETRGRWGVGLEFRPQLFVDAHEMGALDTFLFYPQAKPHHPALPDKLIHWQGVFADDHAKAFDQHGWGYYTREWADAWYPGYSDAWGSLNAAIGILYEQGGVGGQALRRESGEVVSYRESVHGQAVASVSNLTTLKGHRREILAEYLAARRASCDASRPGGDRAFVFTGGGRARELVRALSAQGVEVHRARAGFTASEVAGMLGDDEETREFPAGTYVVPVAQPQGALVHAYLDFDPRIGEESLQKEREELEAGRDSNIYDVTAWDLGRSFDLDSWWCSPGPADLERVDDVEDAAPLGVVRRHHERTGSRAYKPFDDAAYAWVIDGDDDGSVQFAARAMELGLSVHLSDRDFRVRVGDELLSMPRGSLLLRRHENDEELDGVVARVADEAGVWAIAITTGRSPDDGPDLGGGHFHLLARPRVALLANSPVSGEDFGHVWRYLDEELRVPVTLVDAQSFGSYDLRRYNVLVIPPGRIESALGAHADDLRTWVRSGGTIVAMGSSAAGLTGDPFDVTSVVRRRDALDELDSYAALARREEEAREIEIDFAGLWGDPEIETPAAVEEADDEDESTDDAGGDPDLERQDAWKRRFAPVGVILRGLVRDDSWLTVGRRDELPVYFSGSSVLLSRGTVPVRLAPADRLRLGGLVWPEARERIADSAWLTVESQGYGQVILFAAPPAFRGNFRGTARLLGNAVVYGPGAGARQPSGW